MGLNKFISFISIASFITYSAISYTHAASIGENDSDEFQTVKSILTRHIENNERITEFVQLPPRSYTSNTSIIMRVLAELPKVDRIQVIFMSDLNFDDQTKRDLRTILPRFPVLTLLTLNKTNLDANDLIEIFQGLNFSATASTQPVNCIPFGEGGLRIQIESEKITDALKDALPNVEFLPA